MQIGRRQECSARVELNAQHRAAFGQREQVSANATAQVEHQFSHRESPRLVARDLFIGCLFERHRCEEHSLSGGEFLTRTPAQRGLFLDQASACGRYSAQQAFRTLQLRQISIASKSKMGQRLTARQPAQVAPFRGGEVRHQ